MKTLYVKPETVVVLLSTDNIMIGASAEGQTIVEDGGSTSGSSITTADSRRGGIWDDED